MTIYSQKPLKLDKVSTYPLASRASKVTVQDFARIPRTGAGVRAWLDSLPHILAAESLRAVVAAIERARAKGKPIIWGIGGHVVKCGLAPILIDLMRRGYLTALAMNGAAMIHDFEIGLVGATSEDVPAVLGRGKFGMAEETGRWINETIAAGDREDLGIGEAVGRFLARRREARFRRFSLLAQAYALRVPCNRACRRGNGHYPQSSRHRSAGDGGRLAPRFPAARGPGKEPRSRRSLPQCRLRRFAA